MILYITVKYKGLCLLRLELAELHYQPELALIPDDDMKIFLGYEIIIEWST